MGPLVHHICLCTQHLLDSPFIRPAILVKVGIPQRTQINRSLDISFSLPLQVNLTGLFVHHINCTRYPFKVQISGYFTPGFYFLLLQIHIKHNSRLMRLFLAFCCEFHHISLLVMTHSFLWCDVFQSAAPVNAGRKEEGGWGRVAHLRLIARGHWLL